MAVYDPVTRTVLHVGAITGGKCSCPRCVRGRAIAPQAAVCDCPLCLSEHAGRDDPKPPIRRPAPDGNRTIAVEYQPEPEPEPPAPERPKLEETVTNFRPMRL